MGDTYRPRTRRIWVLVAVAGIGMCRDEADIAATTLRHLATQVDFLIVADNGSVDGTRDILADLSRELPLTVIDDLDRAYYQSRKMTSLSRLAGERGATWVVPADFDEIWYSRFDARIADLLDGLAPQWLTAEADLYDHVATAHDPDIADPVARMGWRRTERAPLRKVACRVRDDLVIEQGNHGASYAGGTTRFPDYLVVRHFPYRSAEQFVRKARNGAQAYAATDLPADVGAHWRQYGDLLEANGEQALEGVFKDWFYSEDPTVDPTLIYDPVR